MKLAFTIIFLLCISFLAPESANAQTRPHDKSQRSNRKKRARPPISAKPSSEIQSEVERLQHKFDLVDVSSQVKNSKIDVWVSGNTEASGKLTINVATPSYGTLVTTESYDVDLDVLSISETFITQMIRAAFSNNNPSGGSIEGVKVRQIAATGDYEVVEDYTYQATGYRITVPKGFVYDRATIPRIFWVIMDKDSLSNVAPLFHDMLYRSGGRLPQNQVSPYRTFTREDADNLFLELMIKCGVIAWRSKAAYEAVRNFAGSHWNGQ